MPDYDSIVDQLSPDDAQSLFAKNGMGDDPMAQQIVRKLKGAATRKRIAKDQAAGVTPVDASAHPENFGWALAKEVPKSVYRMGENVDQAALAHLETASHVGEMPTTPPTSAGVDWQDMSAGDQYSDNPQAYARNAALAHKEKRADPLALTHEYQSARLTQPSKGVQGIGEAILPFVANPVLGAIGTSGNRVQSAVESGVSPGKALLLGGGQAALDTVGAGAAGKLVQAGGSFLKKAALGLLGNEAYLGANAALTNTYDSEAAKQELQNPVSHAMGLIPGALAGVHAGVGRIGEHIDDMQAKAAQNRADEAAAHQADLDAQAKALEVQQGIKNAYLTSGGMRTGPDGTLVSAKSSPPRTPGSGVDLQPQVADLTYQTRLLSPDKTGESRPPATGTIEPTPQADINSAYDSFSGKSRPPVTKPITSTEQVEPTKGASDVIHEEGRTEPQQGLQPSSVEARSDQADVRPNEGRSAGVENAQRPGRDAGQEQGIGSVSESQSQEGVKLNAAMGKAQPRYNFGEKSFTPEFDSPVDKAAYIIASRVVGSKKSLAHDKIVQAAEAEGHNLEDLQARGLDIRNRIKEVARDAESGAQIRVKAQVNKINPTRGGGVDIGAVADTLKNVTRTAKSYIANDPIIVNLERRSGGMARAAQSAAEMTHRDLAKLSPNMQDAVNSYMDGDKTVALPSALRAKVDDFRTRQDKLSEGAAKQADAAADHLERRAGVSALPETAKELMTVAGQFRKSAKTFRSNVGSYVNRDYAIHDQGAKWINKIRDTPVYHDAIADVVQRNPGLTPEQARVKVENLMSDQVADALSPNKGTGSALGSLKERQDISPAIRKLYGEVTDPAQRAAASLLKTSQVLENLKVQNGIADAADKLGLLNEMPKHGAEDYVHLSSISSLKNSPIGGMYAPKDIARMLAGIDAQSNAFTRFLSGASAGTNMAATVGNMAASVPRQALGNTMLAFSNGYLTPRNIIEATKLGKQILTDRAVRERMMELNVVDQGLTRSQLGAQIAGMHKVKDGLSMAGSAAKQGLRAAHFAFSLPDEMLRVLSYASELRRAETRGMKGAQAEEWASGRMGDSTPDWAKAWKGTKAISTRVPVLGQFATMAGEMTRIQLKQIQHAAEAWKSGQTKEAALRTIGLATTMATMYGLGQVALNKMNGVSSEEDKAIRTSNATPNYSESHMLNYGAKDETGKRTVTDISGLNPYYPISEPLTLLLAGKPLAALSQAVSPYVGASMFGQRVGEAFAGSKLNSQGEATAISKPDAGSAERFVDGVLHVAQGVEPAGIRKFRTDIPYSVFSQQTFDPHRAAGTDVKHDTNTYDAYVKGVYAEAAKRGDGNLTDQEAKRIAELQNKRDADLAKTRALSTTYGATSNDLIGAERSNKIRAEDIAHPGDANTDIIKARYRLGQLEKAMATFETFKQMSDTDPAKRDFFNEHQDLIRASAATYEKYAAAKRLLGLAEIHQDKPQIIQKAMQLLK